MKIKGSDGSKFIVNELDNTPCEFHKVEISEECWGGLPTIKLAFKYSQLPVKLNQKLSGSMITEKGNKTTFDGYVHNVTFNNDEGLITVICTKQDFINNKFTTYYSNIDNAINSTWGRNRIDSIKSDILKFGENCRLHQMDETNYHFCNRCCQSYLHKAVYCYRFDGLKFTDLNNWKSEVVLNDRSEAKIVSTNAWEAPRTFSQDLSSEDPNTSVVEFEQDPNHVYVRCDEGLIPVDKEYRDLIGNYLYNQRLIDTPHQVTWSLRYLSEMKCGDMIKINSKFVNYRNSYISSRSIIYDHTNVVENITTKSIDP